MKLGRSLGFGDIKEQDLLPSQPAGFLRPLISRLPIIAQVSESTVAGATTGAPAHCMGDTFFCLKLYFLQDTNVCACGVSQVGYPLYFCLQPQ
jgi:hypothetical protein